MNHLHAFVREVKLTEKEFQEAIGYVNAIGQKTTPSHNEAMLLAGALGVSNLVCLINNAPADAGQQPRPVLPRRRAEVRRRRLFIAFAYARPASCLSRDGFGTGQVNQSQAPRSTSGTPRTVGLYENQDPTQAEMNLRGKFTTREDGSFSFTTVKPAGYPVPTDGPAGALLAAQKRHNMRPAHLHFLVYKPGFKTIASQVYDPQDPHLQTDSQFGVTQALIGDYQKQPDGSYRLEFTFVIEPGEARLPKAPITAKATV